MDQYTRNYPSKIIFILVITVVKHEIAMGVDLTRTEKAYNVEIVNAVLDEINYADIFKNDYQFMKRWAYVETKYGADIANNDAWETISGKGGIWKLSAYNLEAIKSLSSSSIKLLIKNHFKVDIMELKFDQGHLRVPFYCGLAARLFLHIKSEKVPLSIDNQAQLWKEIINLEGNIDTFKSQVVNMPSECISAAADVLFVLDSSGSIGAETFKLQRNFVKNVANNLELHDEAYKMGVDVFSNIDQITTWIPISSNKTEILLMTEKIPYYNSWTYIAEALLHAVNYSLRTENGMRESKLGIPKVLILITDGQPSPLETDTLNKTRNASELIKALGVEFISIGVGNAPDFILLSDMASKPKNLHVFHLDTYYALANEFVPELIQRTCTSLATLEEEAIIQNTIKENEVLYYQYEVRIETGFTVTVETSDGEVILYLSTKIRFPNEFSYDYKVVATPKQLGEIYLSPELLKELIKHSSSGNRRRRQTDDEIPQMSTVFLGVKGLRSSNTFTLTGNAGDHRQADTANSTSAPCKYNACCNFHFPLHDYDLMI